MSKHSHLLSIGSNGNHSVFPSFLRTIRIFNIAVEMSYEFVEFIYKTLGASYRSERLQIVV